MEGVVKSTGFSLIEVLAAMALALFLITAAAELITFSMAAKRKGDRASAAGHALAARLEGLKTLPFESGDLGAGEHSSTVRDGPSRTSFLEVWTIEDAGPAMKRVKIVVTPAGHPEAAASLVLYISKDLGFAP